MEKIALSLFFIIIVGANTAFTLQATVNSWNALLETDREGGRSIILMPGTVVDSDKTVEGYLHVSYEGKTGWVRKERMSIYENIFSNEKSRPLLFRKILRENDKDFLFYHMDGKLVKYNITDRLLDIEQRVPDFQEMYGSSNGLFLIKGIVTNGDTVDNLEIFDIKTGKSAYIGSFKESMVYTGSVKFSGDGSYVSVIYLISGKRILCVYKTSSGVMTAYTTEALDSNWRNSLLIISDYSDFWTIDLTSPPQDGKLDYNPGNLLFSVKPGIQSRFLKSEIVNGDLYADTGKGVLKYDFLDKSVTQTMLKSLNFNRDLSLNYYQAGGRIILHNFKLGHDLYEFCGKEPEVDFVFFTDSGIIGRAKYEKIDTIFLYSVNGGSIYRYKAIDDPAACGDNGILAEIDQERDISILTVEDPEKQEFFYILGK
jgi:hypothetical protein